MRKSNRNSRNTIPTTIRLTRHQVVRLEKLPDGVTVGILLRALVDAYLDGKIPYSLVMAEAMRTNRAVESTQFQRGEQNVA